ncbi:Starch-binding associating with outer membrane [Catalinimonas alkaloidigena]|uniref:Starch-binding associating with outer membrane n=1 Tax=Catalinimonas alkaloidigena TaxID=1075417 RepID=A0A1G8XF35_9BACT|nr:RagB/SusD family nutrient uptake outer membrane protein [Catalinimonas alkaloidigena]SDJ88924.1 Starch-binding associating with outer membrane [Catalinimonas alkaloidigena]
MKSLFPNKVILALGLLALTACEDFLVEEPKTQLTEAQVYGSEENIRLLVSGLYTQWRNTKQDRGGFMFTLGTDEAKQGGQQVRENNVQAALDKYNGALNASNTSLAEQWNKRWPVVAAAAKAVYYANTDDIKAQASFIRATLNFELAMLWGPIPIIDLEDMHEARQPLPAVFASIVRDLEFAVEHLPDTQTDKKIPTKSAAEALLGKVYLYAPEESGLRDYSKALSYFDRVIPKHALLPVYADLFNTTLDQNSSESIYAFQFENIWPDNNMAQHHAGSRAVADLDNNTYFGGYDLILPTAYCYQNREDGGIWEPGDTRRDVSIRYDFTLPDGREPTITWTGMQDELEPHIKKYEDERTQGVQNFWYSGGNIYYLRLSDILLCKAECLNELGQTAAAVDLVNSTVRTRAFGGMLPAEYTWPASMSTEEFRAQVLDERMRELCFEGWRRMDLIRTGKLVQLVGERNPWAQAEGALAAYHMRYPIPESEIKQNDQINEEDQNPGY